MFLLKFYPFIGFFLIVVEGGIISREDSQGDVHGAEILNNGEGNIENVQVPGEIEHVAEGKIAGQTASQIIGGAGGILGQTVGGTLNLGTNLLGSVANALGGTLGGNLGLGGQWIGSDRQLSGEENVEILDDDAKDENKNIPEKRFAGATIGNAGQVAGGLLGSVGQLGGGTIGAAGNLLGGAANSILPGSASGGVNCNLGGGDVIGFGKKSDEAVERPVEIHSDVPVTAEEQGPEEPEIFNVGSPDHVVEVSNHAGERNFGGVLNLGGGLLGGAVGTVGQVVNGAVNTAGGLLGTGVGLLSGLGGNLGGWNCGGIKRKQPNVDTQRFGESIDKELTQGIQQLIEEEIKSGHHIEDEGEVEEDLPIENQHQVGFVEEQNPIKEDIAHEEIPHLI